MLFLNHFSQKSMRYWQTIGFLYCAILLAIAFFLQFYQNLHPCPLCVLDRGVIMLCGLLFLNGALHWPKTPWLNKIYALLTLTASLLGMGITSYHVWLQYLPKEKMPSCGPDLSYLLDNFPLHEVMLAVFKGAGECTKVDWRFLGFSLAELTLAGMSLLTGLCLIITRKAFKPLKNKG